MRWPWTRGERPMEPNHTAPVVDGDTVVAPGQRRWADLLAGQPESPVGEATVPLPTLSTLAAAPLLTRAGWWRATGGRS